MLVFLDAVKLVHRFPSCFLPSSCLLVIIAFPFVHNPRGATMPRGASKVPSWTNEQNRVLAGLLQDGAIDLEKENDKEYIWGVCRRYFPFHSIEGPGGNKTARVRFLQKKIRQRKIGNTVQGVRRQRRAEQGK